MSPTGGQRLSRCAPAGRVSPHGHAPDPRGPQAREGAAVSVGMLGLAAVAWVGLLSASMSADMRKGLLTGGSLLSSMHGSAGSTAMPGMAMPGTGGMSLLGVRLSQGAVFTWPYFGGFLWMWVVMLAAMMFPVALPSVRRYRQLRPTGSRLQFAGFLGAYFMIYVGAGVVAYLALATVQSWISGPTADDVRIAALVLGLVGVYQLSHAKGRVLGRCIACECGLRHERSGRTAGLRDGLAHGWSCLACCGPLMIVMLLIGMMNLAWMAILALLMLLERLPRGRFAIPVAGSAFLAGALLLLASPSSFPSLW